MGRGCLQVDGWRQDLAEHGPFSLPPHRRDPRRPDGPRRGLRGRAGNVWDRAATAGFTRRRTAARAGTACSTWTTTPARPSSSWIREIRKVLYAATYQRRRATWGFNGGGPGSGIHKTTDGGRPGPGCRKGFLRVRWGGSDSTPTARTRTWSTRESSTPTREACTARTMPERAGRSALP